MGYSSGRDIGAIAQTTAYSNWTRGQNDATIRAAVAGEARNRELTRLCRVCGKAALYIDWKRGTKGLTGLCREHKSQFRGGVGRGSFVNSHGKVEI